jgi:hypothetical protein
VMALFFCVKILYGTRTPTRRSRTQSGVRDMITYIS